MRTLLSLPSLQRQREILKLALPLIGGMLSQSLINLVDSAMVGALGSTALAAAGIAGYTAFVITALILGISSAVQSSTAYFYGAKCKKSQHKTLNAGLILAFLLCLPLIAFFYPITGLLLSYINYDGAVVELAEPYLNWRVVGLLAVGLNLVFRGYWNGVHHSKIYFKTIVFIHLSNIAISYLLIYGKLG
ncbi:MATE family efflux transporter, partial [Oceanospirillum sp. HFRX-1_2]